jgi:hypothetical protein
VSQVAARENYVHPEFLFEGGIAVFEIACLTKKDINWGLPSRERKKAIDKKRKI